MEHQLIAITFAKLRLKWKSNENDYEFSVVVVCGHLWPWVEVEGNTLTMIVRTGTHWIRNWGGTRSVCEIVVVDRWRNVH